MKQKNTEVDFKKLGRKSKRKGKTGEREVVNLLKEHGFDARRTAQCNGKLEHSLADVECLEMKAFHIEVKRTESLNINKAMQQSMAECKDKIPTVFHRKNEMPWMVTMTAEDWMKVFRLGLRWQEVLLTPDKPFDVTPPGLYGGAAEGGIKGI